MLRDQFVLDINNEIIVDNFADGGGASSGIEMALGRCVDVAINHDAEAIAMHSMNHPQTRHYCESVWDVDPLEVTQGRPVGLGWFSPDCKHFSKAKGGKPREKRIRGLAWVVLRWAALVRPRVIMLENVSVRCKLDVVCRLKALGFASSWRYETLSGLVTGAEGG